MANPENSQTGASPAESGGTASVEASAGKPFTGQGGFSLKGAGRKKTFDKRIVVAIAVGVVIAILLSASIVIFALNSRGNKEIVIDESKVKEAPVLKGERKKDDSMDTLMNEQTKRSTQQASTPLSSPDPTPSSVNDTAAKGEKAPPAATVVVSPQVTASDRPERREESLFSPIVRFDASGLSSGSGGGSDSYGRSPADAGQDPEEARLRAFADTDTQEEVRKLTGGTGRSSMTGRGSLLETSLGGTEYVTARARLALPPRYLLKRRTNFQCVLYTAIRTDYPGFVSCRLTRPLYSADGSVILAEAGAELTGEQSVEVKAGQRSVFTSWTELETAPGVRASLNGLGTDAMGRSGKDAYIDNHYGQRFGGAVMLSFIKDALASAANATKQSGNGYNVSNSEHNAEDMATKALENSINIPPTGYVLPGTVLNVIVAQDIDFSSVYTTQR